MSFQCAGIHALEFFLRGLKTEIRRELLINPPTSLSDAMMKAQLFEERNDSLRGLVCFDNPRVASISNLNARVPLSNSSPLPPSTIGRPHVSHPSAAT